MKDFYILLIKDFYILLMKDYFVFEDMNDIDKSHFLFLIKEPFRAEQLTKNLIQ